MKSIQVINRNTGKIFTEKPPSEGLLKFIYQTTLGKLPLHLAVKRKFVSALMGKQMNKESSAKKISRFVQDFNVDMKDALLSIQEYKTFNDFFYRKLKPTARPIQEGFVSPADGKILVFENISKTKEFFVKGNQFTLNKFLQNQALAEKYKNATLILVRLAPDDYHRYHFPYAGRIAETKLIKGAYYSVSPYAVKEHFTIFCENKRSLATLKTKDKGDVIISEIGATMVGSIFQTYQANTDIAKGDEKGYFAFGGSSVILLIDADKITIDKDLLANTKKGFETTIKMGERIGV